MIWCALTRIGPLVEAAIMNAINLRIGTALASGIVFALLAATAQEAPPPSTKPGDAERLTVERDKEKEDQVAKLFEGIRAEAKVPRLKRIQHRPQLEQGICTGALTGGRPKGASAFYTTTDPQSPAPELRKIASSNPLDRYHPGRPIYERYSVAVWKTKAPQSGNADYYLVGVGMYGSAAGEFVDCHFTDDVHYCGKWKETIAPPCRGK
jgi:hypothetical protein